MERCLIRKHRLALEVLILEHNSRTETETETETDCPSEVKHDLAWPPRKHHIQGPHTRHGLEKLKVSAAVPARLFIRRFACIP